MAARGGWPRRCRQEELVRTLIRALLMTAIAIAAVVLVAILLREAGLML
jgi:hypothetical protein